MLQVMWVGCAVVIIASALRATHSRRAMRTGQLAVAALYLGAGALVNAVFLLQGEDYARFADGAYIPFVRDTWRDLVVPNHEVFISLLIAFEAAVGILVLRGARHAEIGLAAAIGFHVALLSFGWGFYLWSVPMTGALIVLLRATCCSAEEQASDSVLSRDRLPAAGELAAREVGIDLYWIPLGAGGHSVRFNGIVYEALSAALHRRRRYDIFHAALLIHAPVGRFAVEMTPVPNRRGWERGVVAGGPVGTKHVGRFRIFRYEVRCWRDGTIPDLHYASAGPIRVTGDPGVTQDALAVLPQVPTATWGRDELHAGEMWSCNSIIAWTLTKAGIDPGTIALPPHARAPGWDAGIVVAQRPAPSIASTADAIVSA